MASDAQLPFNRLRHIVRCKQPPFLPRNEAMPKAASVLTGWTPPTETDCFNTHSRVRKRPSSVKCVDAFRMALTGKPE
ncbi:hypothetical protein HMPREF9141_2083 [Prevotella multiformis DSM 16608]|uniref:Uncharacterized protein n=1 Tax=Prevotella multiformis DSM 16608 TaxID=888743 RepID=F0F916_9BACT|nr:hypothetical protein HMPREF9141_2083 [Prevotella multiformis DSM 16608]